jgi:hypothetical protein
MPSAELNYSRPAIATNRRPVTSRAQLKDPHNARCVFPECDNKSAYHLHTNINCGDNAPTRDNVNALVTISAKEVHQIYIKSEYVEGTADQFIYATANVHRLQPVNMVEKASDQYYINTNEVA